MTPIVKPPESTPGDWASREKQRKEGWQLLFARLRGLRFYKKMAPASGIGNRTVVFSSSGRQR